jgi:hypothetical protein
VPESDPAIWPEHWFDHHDLVRLYATDEHVSVYTDAGVSHGQLRWLPRFASRAWQYSKLTYGGPWGPGERLYLIVHGGKHGGGHAGYYFSPVHDYRNVGDCGLDSWSQHERLALDIPSHEISHVVESANNGRHGSPAYTVWGDSKWAEFYQYDLYMALGMEREAGRLYGTFMSGTDTFPRPGTRWFRDWFYPLWRDAGQAAYMARFYKLLARDFPGRAGGGDLAPAMQPATAGRLLRGATARSAAHPALSALRASQPMRRLAGDPRPAAGPSDAGPSDAGPSDTASRDQAPDATGPRPGEPRDDGWRDPRPAASLGIGAVQADHDPDPGPGPAPVPARPPAAPPPAPYERRLNWGEYIHFSSGAAEADLRPMAARAFGWPDEWTIQLERAQHDFPLVTY